MKNYTLSYLKLYNSGDEFPCNCDGIETYHNNWNEFEYLYELMQFVHNMKEYVFDLDYSGSPGLMLCTHPDDIKDNEISDNEENYPPTMVISINIELKTKKDQYRQDLLELICCNLTRKEEHVINMINELSILEFIIKMINNFRWENDRF